MFSGISFIWNTKLLHFAANFTDVPTKFLLNKSCPHQTYQSGHAIMGIIKATVSLCISLRSLIGIFIAYYLYIVLSVFAKSQIYNTQFAEQSGLSLTW